MARWLVKSTRVQRWRGPFNIKGYFWRHHLAVQIDRAVDQVGQAKASGPDEFHWPTNRRCYYVGRLRCMTGLRVCCRKAIVRTRTRRIQGNRISRWEFRSATRRFVLPPLTNTKYNVHAHTLLFYLASSELSISMEEQEVHSTFQRNPVTSWP